MVADGGEGITVAFAFDFSVAVASAAAVVVASAVAVVFAFDLPGSLPKRRPARGKTPKGRRTWMYAVRGRGRMPLPRIPGLDADPERVSAEGARQGALSFGYLFFARAKKSNSPARAKAFAVADAFAVKALKL
ncbi:hypothetical protein [Xanthomonas sp. LMG 8989]|uniref:hypothetical protein n=1 Tax=Xanthomonas sp. LMG 8989 TaxID=1591156 RepID=UPI00136CDE63|nr:hypothetical protein [Xanthomonas sp. LMG 8989]